jgi:hypothetical protein
MNDDKPAASQQIAAGKSRCLCQLRLIYEICLSLFHSASRSAAVPELGSLIWLRNVKQAIVLLSESFHFPGCFTAAAGER